MRHSRNELKAALAAQMVAVHVHTMELKARAIKQEYDTQTASVVGKLTRIFTAQRDAFERIRKPSRTSRRSIKVTTDSHYRQNLHLHRGRRNRTDNPMTLEPRRASEAPRCRATNRRASLAVAQPCEAAPCVSRMGRLQACRRVNATARGSLGAYLRGKKGAQAGGKSAYGGDPALEQLPNAASG